MIVITICKKNEHFMHFMHFMVDYYLIGLANFLNLGGPIKMALVAVWA